MNTLPEIYEKKKFGSFLKWFKSAERTNKFLLKFFDENMSGNLLDIGAWDGSLGKLLPKEVEYYPMDVAKINHPNAIQLYLKKNLHLPENFFDYIICDQTLEHLLYPFDICKEIHRVLKPDGKALIGLPNDDGLFARLNFLYLKFESIENQEFMHHWNFTYKNSAEFLDKCGFKIIKHSGRFGFTSPLITWLSPIILFKVVKKWI